MKDISGRIGWLWLALVTIALWFVIGFVFVMVAALFRYFVETGASVLTVFLEGLLFGSPLAVSAMSSFYLYKKGMPTNRVGKYLMVLIAVTPILIAVLYTGFLIGVVLLR